MGIGMGIAERWNPSSSGRLQPHPVLLRDGRLAGVRLPHLAHPIPCRLHDGRRRQPVPHRCRLPGRSRGPCSRGGCGSRRHRRHGRGTMGDRPPSSPHVAPYRDSRATSRPAPRRAGNRNTRAPVRRGSEPWRLWFRAGEGGAPARTKQEPGASSTSRDTPPPRPAKEQMTGRRTRRLTPSL
jgi:hypothetical protein